MNPAVSGAFMRNPSRISCAKGLNDFSLAHKIQEIFRGGLAEVVDAFAAQQVRISIQNVSLNVANQWIWLIHE
jgi:hypothetical protein